MKSRLVTLCTCQWADMDFEELCALAKKMGYDGLEIATWGKSFDLDRAYEDDGYMKFIQDTLAKNGLVCKALATHIIGQCVGDAPDPGGSARGHQGVGHRQHEESRQGGRQDGRQGDHRFHRLPHLEVAVLLPPDHRGDDRERL